MVRYKIIAFAAVAALALSAMTTGASARHHHSWHGGPWGLVAPALIGLAAAPLIWGPPVYAYGYGCYIRRERVLTPWGWRWRRVEVCD